MAGLQPADSAEAEPRFGGGVRVRMGSSVHNRVHEFLNDEAAALDENRFVDWLGFLAQDIRYTVPVRITRLSDDPRPVIDRRGTQFMNDDYAGLQLRVTRLAHTASAFAEDPRSRTRRFITNVAVWDTCQADEYAVRSYLLLGRNRSDIPDNSWLSAERRDLVRFLDEERTVLARREVLMDTAVLGMSNMGVFL